MRNFNHFPNLINFEHKHIKLINLVQTSGQPMSHKPTAQPVLKKNEQEDGLIPKTVSLPLALSALLSTYYVVNTKDTKVNKTSTRCRCRYFDDGSRGCKKLI